VLDVGEDELLVLLLVLQAEATSAAISASSLRWASSACMRSSTFAR
jgi:hypothetical protein